MSEETWPAIDKLDSKQHTEGFSPGTNPLDCPSLAKLVATDLEDKVRLVAGSSCLLSKGLCLLLSGGGNDAGLYSWRTR